MTDLLDLAEPSAPRRKPGQPEHRLQAAIYHYLKRPLRIPHGAVIVTIAGLRAW